MPKYNVEWAITIEADTPREAAIQALKIQRDPTSLATCFDVTDEETKVQTPHDIENDEVESDNA